MRYTLEQAAELLDISVQYLGAIERNTRRPSLELLIKICLFYETSTDYLLYGSNDNLSSNPSNENDRDYSLLYRLNDEQFETVMQIAAIISCKNFAKRYLDFLLSHFILTADFITKSQNSKKGDSQ